METKHINILGINRDKSKDSFADGDCQEIINMRLRDGAWRIVRSPKKDYNGLADTYDGMYLHDQDNVHNFIGYNVTSGELRLVDVATGSSTLIKTYTAGTTVKVQFLKRFMLVIHSDGIDKFLFKDGVYTLVNLAYPPKMRFQSHTESTTTTDIATTAESLLGKYRNIMITENQKWGTLEGAIMFRIAYKLFDGSYVLHSLPIYHNVANMNAAIVKVSGGYQLRFYTAWIYGMIDRAYYAAFSGMRDIISSVAIFACKNERFFQVDEFTLTDAVLASCGSGATYFTSLLSTMNDAYKRMADSSAWYKIHELPFDQAADIYQGAEVMMDWEGFVTDFAVHETLPVDSFSYHQLVSDNMMVFNDRLHLGNVSTILGDFQNPTLTAEVAGKYVNPVQKETYLMYSLSTDQGVVNKLTLLENATYFTRVSDGMTVLVFDNYVIGYPDARATELKLITEDAGTYYITGRFTLTKSAYDNYAFYHDPDFQVDDPDNDGHNFCPIECQITLDPNQTVNVDDYHENLLTDANRVQVSELRNPYVFPAKYSYQVGTGEIRGIGTNTEPMSDSQYGQYPLIVFSSKGIMALEQGSGGVLFGAISPVSGDVAVSTDQIINASTGVIFVTARGVFLISGKKIMELSENVEGPINTDFTANLHFQHFISTANLVTLNGMVSSVDALTFLSGSKAAFDKINNEVYFCHPDYSFSYVFSLETNTWHKVSTTYDLFINNYPYLLGVMQGQGAANGIYNLGIESTTLIHPILIVTQPQSVGLPGIYKKIERTILRCNLNVSLATYFTYAIFGSDDLITWQFLTGGQRTGNINNILTTRTHGSCTYYIFMLSGQIEPGSTISGIDISVSPRLQKKLRT